jgi:hypothetical protein
MAPAMKNGRCRMHGGSSTGPRTAEGLEKSRKASITHGRYSEDARSVRRRFAERDRQIKWLADQIADDRPKGLQQKCAAALSLWQRSLTFRDNRPVAENEQRDERCMTILLKAGAAGDSPAQICSKVSHFLSYDGSLA